MDGVWGVLVGMGSGRRWAFDVSISQRCKNDMKWHDNDLSRCIWYRWSLKHVCKILHAHSLKLMFGEGNALVASRDPSKMQHSDTPVYGISLCWQISWWMKWVFYTWMNMLNMNVYRHRYWNLFSLLPLFVTHHHTAFLIVPGAPCKLSVLKVLRCSSSRPRKDWVVTEQSFADDRHLPFLRNLLLLLEDDFSILHFFFAKVLQHIHLCMFKSA